MRLSRVSWCKMLELWRGGQSLDDGDRVHIQVLQPFECSPSHIAGHILYVSCIQCCISTFGKGDEMRASIGTNAQLARAGRELVRIGKGWYTDLGMLT